MRVPLVRFGVAMEQPLLAELDRIVEARGATRSEVLRDLVRAEVVKERVRRGVEAVATLTLVYDHHVRDLTERLNELQHELGDHVRSTLHIHLSHELCLEVIVMHGRSDRLQDVADRILATRGVKHGGLEIITDLGDSERRSRAHRHEHSHSPGHPHAHAPPSSSRRKRKAAARPA